MFAPTDTRYVATSEWPLASATSNAVPHSSASTLTSALASTSNWTTLRKPWSLARIKGVTPSSFFSFASAPTSSSASTAPASPPLTACINKGLPSSVRVSRSARYSRRIRTASPWPPRAAITAAVLPSYALKPSGNTPPTSNSRTCATFPFRANSNKACAASSSAAVATTPIERCPCLEQVLVTVSQLAQPPRSTCRAPRWFEELSAASMPCPSSNVPNGTASSQAAARSAAAYLSPCNVALARSSVRRSAVTCLTPQASHPFPSICPFPSAATSVGST
mmetsp:Transcript_61187/g.171154  ORF Transcript_61187/g.171154 Transcript_61187/m.171154 type:complete len:279 (-) Transcript_61187:10-846(-)